MGVRAILVVDDEKPVLDIFTIVLSQWGGPRGIAVLPAASAADALAILEREAGSIELIISDLNMPVMRGSDFLLAAKDLYPEITTMIVSGGGDIEEVRRVIGTGIFSYLLKPCDPATLTAEVEKALEVSRLKRENRRYEQMIRDELRWAGELQRTLLHAEPVRDAGLAVSVTYIPLPELQCGGDYYEVIPVSARQTLFLIGDVGGHGIRAALITAMLKSIISASREIAQPRRLLEHLNARICSDLKRLPDLIITFLACLLDTSSLTLTSANAGHLPLFILREEKAIRVLPEGMGLGFSPDARYEQTVVPLARGDTVVMCTDGLLEGLSDSPTDAESRFSRILLACAGEADFNTAVIDEAKRAAAKGGFSDDAALLSVKVQ
ncbi:MAG: fused response regulator/phosphatase [Spirochaetes bacterium]|nr:fused response regulator/phosphatase [Spirochaetota bacterium]